MHQSAMLADMTFVILLIIMNDDISDGEYKSNEVSLFREQKLNHHGHPEHYFLHRQGAHNMHRTFYRIKKLTLWISKVCPFCQRVG